MFKPPETIKIEHYEINKKEYVGKGQYGVVYRCKDIKNPELLLCAKVLYQKEVDEKLLKREINILKLLASVQNENQNLVKVYDILEDQTKNVIYLIMEYCDQGDLKCLMDKHKKLKTNFQEEEATKIVSQVIKGYMALYQNHVIHRDIKPANILINQGIVKIADLGMGRIIEDMNYASNFTKVGTPAYAAPQLFIDNRFSSKADVYSLGVIYYQMIHGSLPIEAKTQPELIEKLRSMEQNPIVSTCQNENIKRVIEGMLQFQESKRLSWEELFKEPLFQLNEIRQQSKRLSFTKKINYQQYYRTDYILLNDEKDKLLQIIKILLVRSDLAQKIYKGIEELHLQNNSQLSILNLCLSGYRNKVIWNVFGILYNKPEQICQLIKSWITQDYLDSLKNSHIESLKILREYTSQQLSSTNLQFKEDECKFLQSGAKINDEVVKQLNKLIEQDTINEFVDYQRYFIQFYSNFVSNQQKQNQQLDKLFDKFNKQHNNYDLILQQIPSEILSISQGLQ